MAGLFRSRRQSRAFEQQMLDHLDALYGMALRLTRDQGDAEDLVQNTIVKALRFRQRFAEGSNLKAWLFKILTNTFYNSVRKRGNIRRLEAESGEEWAHDQFLSSATTAGKQSEDRLIDSIDRDRLQQAIDELSDEFRTAVVLCDVYDFSYKEIAEILDCPVGTVMSRLYRGRRALQKRLYDYAVQQGVIEPEPREDDGRAPTRLDTYRKRRGS